MVGARGVTPGAISRSPPSSVQQMARSVWARLLFYLPPRGVPCAGSHSYVLTAENPISDFTGFNSLITARYAGQNFSGFSPTYTLFVGEDFHRRRGKFHVSHKCSNKAKNEDPKIAKMTKRTRKIRSQVNFGPKCTIFQSQKNLRGNRKTAGKKEMENYGLLFSDIIYALLHGFSDYVTFQKWINVTLCDFHDFR